MIKIDFTDNAIVQSNLLDVNENSDTLRFTWFLISRDEWALQAHPHEWLQQVLQGADANLAQSLMQLHTRDLLNTVHPSWYDYGKGYDLLIFRQLLHKNWHENESFGDKVDELPGTSDGTSQNFREISKKQRVQSSDTIAVQTQAAGFLISKKVLLSIYPTDATALHTIVTRYCDDRQRLAQSPIDLVLRICNDMVDTYLELRKPLSIEVDKWQDRLVRPLHTPLQETMDWSLLLALRGRLHGLQDLCEEQQDALQELQDAFMQKNSFIANSQIQTVTHDRLQIPELSPNAVEPLPEILLARSRDIIEHIDRILRHTGRLEQKIESMVQIHFSIQGQRTNDIMRTLTVLTAIFLPLNLLAGVFGMNFDALPLAHHPMGFWVTSATMVSIAFVLTFYFKNKRYLL